MKKKKAFLMLLIKKEGSNPPKGKVCRKAKSKVSSVRIYNYSYNEKLNSKQR